MAWMHPDFSFQGSRPVTKGFKDPRDPEVGLGHTMTFNLFGLRPKSWAFSSKTMGNLGNHEASF